MLEIWWREISCMFRNVIFQCHNIISFHNNLLSERSKILSWHSSRSSQYIINSFTQSIKLSGCQHHVGSFLSITFWIEYYHPHFTGTESESILITQLTFCALTMWLRVYVISCNPPNNYMRSVLLLTFTVLRNKLELTGFKKLARIYTAF